MNHRINFPTTVVMVALVLAAVAVGATLFSLGSGNATPSMNDEGASKADRPVPIQSVEPALKAGFSIFRTPTEGVPQNVDRMFSSSQRTANVDLAQRAHLPGADGPVWVIPADNQVCLFIERPGGGASSCTTTARALTGGLDLQLATGDRDGPLTVATDIRLVPDRSIDSNGQVNEVRVTDNLYLAPRDETRSDEGEASK